MSGSLEAFAISVREAFVSDLSLEDDLGSVAPLAQIERYERPGETAAPEHASQLHPADGAPAADRASRGPVGRWERAAGLAAAVAHENGSDHENLPAQMGPIPALIEMSSVSVAPHRTQKP